MRRSDLVELVGLAALWGGSFLFIRMGASVFGPIALCFVRVAGATAFLLPLLAMRGQLPALRAHWRPILLVGITNSALPFVLFSYAALAITSGLSAVFNAATPLFAALIAWLWLKDRLTHSRIVGLGVGFAGVLWLVWDKASFKPGEHGVSTGMAVLACMAGTLFYGYSASYSKRFLAGVPPMAVAAGSQVGATLALAIPAALWWPDTPPGVHAWTTALLLAVLCTGVAYVIFFRLIANVGPANAVSVTFLIPAFAVLWGWLFLDESLTASMVFGCLVIIAGTSLVTGVLKLPQKAGG